MQYYFSTVGKVNQQSQIIFWHSGLLIWYWLNKRSKNIYSADQAIRPFQNCSSHVTLSFGPVEAFLHDISVPRSMNHRVTHVLPHQSWTFLLFQEVLLRAALPKIAKLFPISSAGDSALLHSYDELYSSTVFNQYIWKGGYKPGCKMKWNILKKPADPPYCGYQGAFVDIFDTYEESSGENLKNLKGTCLSADSTFHVRMGKSVYDCNEVHFLVLNIVRTSTISMISSRNVKICTFICSADVICAQIKYLEVAEDWDEDRTGIWKLIPFCTDRLFLNWSRTFFSRYI